jgi:hypothetical protein
MNEEMWQYSQFYESVTKILLVLDSKLNKIEYQIRLARTIWMVWVPKEIK